ncbi:hypothetical protein AHMF7616_00784 [Adhaeribacter pallidiroseus]|uniref:Uncharacterized protein n=1 Tax=Adhaeribacter pallidiroseus TaxID=2072847 RepID=A0A369QB94_9BACT|nr:hypothetical protein AHMF7616_00784 [Adhaeribacter pallidiroseus]
MLTPDFGGKAKLAKPMEDFSKPVLLPLTGKRQICYDLPLQPIACINTLAYVRKKTQPEARISGKI